MQREIEARGLATVLITVSPDQSQAMRPPRAFYPEGFAIGRIVGGAGDRATHRRVVERALGLLVGAPDPGKVTRSIV